MRLALLLITYIAGNALFAETTTSSTPAVTDAKPINTVCVVCGAPVDDTIFPIAGKSTAGKSVMIGCCSESCATEVRKNPNQYADAALANKEWKKDPKVK